MSQRVFEAGGRLVRCPKLQKRNGAIERRFRLDDYECSNLENSMGRLRQESSPASRVNRPESISEHQG